MWLTDLSVVMEEKFEQDFLSRKRHFAETGGQYNLQLMHYKEECKKDKGERTNYRAENFLYRYSQFRNIKVKKSLVSALWRSGLEGRYGEYIKETVDNVTGITWVTFEVAGSNHTVTTPTTSSGISPEIVIENW